MNRIFRGLNLAVLLSLIISSAAAFADNAPDCLSYHRPLAVNSDQVIHWKRTTANQFRERGHVQGVVVPYPQLPSSEQPVLVKNGHDHFVIQIGKHPEDLLEVIYNSDFGDLPQIKEGDQIEACGDYITSTAQSGPYPASPVGGIIHWVHKSPNLGKHDSGFVMVNGALFGNGPDRNPRGGDSPVAAFAN